MTCDRCGETLHVGDWPFCPHGPVGSVHIVSDEFAEGPHWCETLGHDPVWVESKSQLRREAAARGLECVGGRKSDDYFRRQRQRHMEELRDLGKNVEY